MWYNLIEDKPIGSGKHQIMKICFWTGSVLQEALTYHYN